MFRQLGLVALPFVSTALAQVSDGFESGWDQTKWPTYAPSCGQGGVVSLDTSVAHTGKNSLKVTPAEGYCGHIFFGTTDLPAGDVYVRTWLQASQALTGEHVSFIIMPDAAEGATDHLRFGSMDQVMIYNRESDDATLPDLSPQGISTSVDLPSGSWQCVEFRIGTDGTIETWLNSVAVPGLTVGPGVTNANDNGWTRTAYKPDITGVYFGWEDYSGSENTFWYDDVAIASTRVGCAVSGATGSSGTSSSPVNPAPSSSAARTTLATSTTAAAPAPAPSCAIAKYGQCGGIGWAGCSTCASGSTCQANGAYYSQCL